MKEISVSSCCSKIYTNHCIRQTCTIALAKSGFQAFEIVSVMKHRSLESLKSYIQDPTVEEHAGMADAMCQYTKKLTANKSAKKKNHQVVMFRGEPIKEVIWERNSIILSDPEETPTTTPVNSPMQQKLHPTALKTACAERKVSSPTRGTIVENVPDTLKPQFNIILQDLGSDEEECTSTDTEEIFEGPLQKACPPYPDTPPGSPVPKSNPYHSPQPKRSKKTEDKTTTLQRKREENIFILPKKQHQEQQLVPTNTQLVKRNTEVVHKNQPLPFTSATIPANAVIQNS